MVSRSPEFSINGTTARLLGLDTRAAALNRARVQRADNDAEPGRHGRLPRVGGRAHERQNVHQGPAEQGKGHARRRGRSRYR